MRLFGRHRKAIEPLNVEPNVEYTEEAEQDNAAGPDDENFEKIEHDEARNAHHGGFPNFGR